MVFFKLNVVLFLNLLSVFKADLETVHFTNSPHKILKANNFTTYKVEVPNGDPITIIEANTALINKKLKFNEVETPKHHDQDNSNHVVDLNSSLSMTITPHNINDNDKYEKLTAVAGEEESVTNAYGNVSPEHSHQSHQHTMKTVYSPELLEKFLKDYANKVQSSEMPTVKPSVDVESEDMKDKYESIEAEGEEDENRRVSTTDVDQEGVELNDVQERKHYRPGSNYQHPYNKNSGWVTLEAVPWSKSKVSKWQSSVKPAFTSHSNYQSNGGYRPNRPGNYNDDDYNDSDDYYSNKPNRPSFQNNQFHGGSSSSYNKPSEAQYSHHSAHHSSSFNNNYDENRPNRPYQPEIITDNRPSNFPNQHEPSSNNDYGYNRPSYDKPSYEQNRPSFEVIRPNSYENRPSSYDRPTRPGHDFHYSSGQSYNYANKDSNHPLTYPGSGEGEWVLVSTTKGYQFPKRHGQRAMLFQAQNGVHGTDTKKYDNGIITAASQQNEVSIRPPFHSQNTLRPPHGPTKMTQQHVKLTVLPLFNNKNENRPIQNQNSNQYHQSGNNNMEVNVYKPSKYNGIIETEPSTQTIEESVAAAASANEANSLASATAQKATTKKKKIRTRNYAVMRKNTGVNGDSTAVLAAVGAGLLPAAFGLIAPMALG